MRPVGDMDTAELRREVALLIRDMRRRERELAELWVRHQAKRETYRRRKSRLYDLRRELRGR